MMRTHLLRYCLLFCLFPLLSSPLLAQNQPLKWSLDQCVAYAVENNLSLKQQTLQKKEMEANIWQQKKGRLPSSNASLGPTWQGGPSVSPSGNGFVDDRFFSYGINASANGEIYNFNNRQNTIEMYQYELKAIDASLSKAKNDVALNIANAYIQILLTSKQIDIFSVAIKQDKAIIEQAQKMIQAGNKPAYELFELDAQLYRDSSNYENMKLQRQQNILNLKLLLNIEPSVDLDIVEVPIQPETINTQVSLMSPEDIFDIAYNNLPQKTYSINKLLATEYQLKSMKKRLYPSFGYNINTGTNATSNDTVINSIFKQFTTYKRYSVGIGVNIPIFDAGNVRGQLKKIAIQYDNQKIIAEQDKYKLKQEVYVSVQNAKTAYLKFISFQKIYHSTLKVVESNDKRYTLGDMNISQLITQKNNLARVENEMYAALYEYLFKQKIVDFYLGQKITL